MQRAFSFPVTLERSRTKERLEASLAGLCELELRKQRQECLVLGALALGEPLLARDGAGGSGGELACFSSWGQENLTLRRQLSALQSSPWGLMQALEQQVGELRIDVDDGCNNGGAHGGDGGDSRPNSGYFESTEGHSPKGRPCPSESTENISPWVYTNDRPKSLGDPVMLNGEADAPVLRTTLPRSFSAPYPTLEGIAEEGSVMDPWQMEPSVEEEEAWVQQQQQQQQQQQLDPQDPIEDQVSEEDYHQAFRVENYIVSLIQRHTLAPRPCQPRTTLSPDPPYCGGSSSHGGSQHRRTPSLGAEPRLPDPKPQPPVDLLPNPKGQGWAGEQLEGESCRAEAPPPEEDCYLALPYPQPRPHSLAGRLPSPLPSLDPNCSVGVLDLCCEPTSPQHYLHPQPPLHPKHSLVSAQYIPGQACHAPVRSPRHYNPEHPKPGRAAGSPDHPGHKSRSSKKTHGERQKSKKSSGKTNRSQSENSLLGQRVVPERRYSTTERHQGRGDGAAQGQGQVAAPQVGGQRWCSNLELSQDEGETRTGQSHRRPPRKARYGHSCAQPQNYHHHHHHHHHLQQQQQQQQQQQHGERWHPEAQERAPLCRGEEGYAGGGGGGAAAPAESESSMSEVYSPASSSLSSDSDESGGLVWPQQLPPRLASTSSSSSPSPQAAATNANAQTQPKAFVKIKASHALKKKILRFRSGSLKVMTTV